MRRSALVAAGLATAVVVAGCNAGPPSPVPRQPTTAAQQDALVAPALWASSDHTRGGVEPVRVIASPDDVPGWSVDLATEQAQGAGAAWTAASGQAASLGTLLSAVDPSSVSVRYEVTGPIDGPSAGGILTVATIAALRGTALLPDVTMTGTVSADGRVGRIGGVDVKADAAIAAGFTTMVVPTGNVPAPVPDGLTVVEVEDVAAAYAAMTGEELFPDEPQAQVALVVRAASARIAQRLSGTEDWATAWNDTLAMVEPVRTVAAATAQAARTHEAFVALMDTELADLDTRDAGELAGVMAALAIAEQADATAAGAAAWVTRHPHDQVGVDRAAVMLAREHAVVTTLVPAMLAVAAAVPGDPVNAAAAEAALRAYAVYQAAAADATRDYIVDVQHTRATDVEVDPLLAARAAALKSLLVAAQNPTSPGLRGAMRAQIAALAATLATTGAKAALDEVIGDAPLHVTAGQGAAVTGLASIATAIGRDPSFPLWLASWAVDTDDFELLLAAATNAAGILAATPPGPTS